MTSPVIPLGSPMMSFIIDVVDDDVALDGESRGFVEVEREIAKGNSGDGH